MVDFFFYQLLQVFSLPPFFSAFLSVYSIYSMILRPRQPKTVNLVVFAVVIFIFIQVLYFFFSEFFVFSDADRYAVWYNVMCDEIAVLRENRIWFLVLFYFSMNVVGSRWVYRIKRRVDGSIERYKARFVVRGFIQQEGIDYSEIFSSVIKQVTV